MPGGHSPFGTRAIGSQAQKRLSPGSAHFDGSSSLELSPGFSIPNGQGFSFSFWVQHTGGAGTYPNIITQTSNPSAAGSNMFWIGFYNLGGVIRPVFYAADGSNASPGGTDLAQNTWRFYAVSYDDSTLNAPTVRAWAGTGPFSAPAGGMDQPVHNNPAQCNLLVGNGFGDGFGQAPAGGMVGNIDSLFFWSRALTDAEGAALFNAGAGLDFAGLSGTLLTGLVAAYNLDGPKAGKWPDSSGNGHNLSINGTVTVGPPRNH